MYLQLGVPNKKQLEFLKSDARFTLYGGARGGGKSWALRTKAVLGALYYPKIRILILRRTYPELERNHVEPLRRLISSAATYNGSNHTFTFKNGSKIIFGHLNNTSDLDSYQGAEFDWLMIDEATQLTEYEFRTLCATLRGPYPYPRRCYLTANPGGVGHAFIKRLFIDRIFIPPEKPEDYVFIPATVEDNVALMRADPHYKELLELLPDSIKSAHRYGDWESLTGSFFREFRSDIHVIPAKNVPQNAAKICAIDYGLDCFACLMAYECDGRTYVYREIEKSNLLASDAVRLIDEKMALSLLPQDLYARQKDTGRSVADIFREHGLCPTRVSSDRVTGWLRVKEALKDRRLFIFDTCPRLIQCISSLTFDKTNPTDASRTPHDITHLTDALRYLMQRNTTKSVSDDTDLERYFLL